MRLSILSLLALSTPLALAQGVEITSPAAGATVPLTSQLTVTWQASGTSPSIGQLLNYQLLLMLGGDDPSDTTTCTQVGAPIVSQGTFTSENTVTGQITIPATAFGSTKNGFYLKMASNVNSGGQVINYSNRFTVSGFTGTTPAAFAAAVNGGTTGPPTEEPGANAAPAAGAADGSILPYGEQNGPTKYAPMQPVPPTKITQKNYTPLNPTSSFSVATTWLPLASIVTTVTASQTFSVSSMENTAAAASQPSGDMAKFLARWKD